MKRTFLQLASRGSFPAYTFIPRRLTAEATNSFLFLPKSYETAVKKQKKEKHAMKVSTSSCSLAKSRRTLDRTHAGGRARRGARTGALRFRMFLGAGFPCKARSSAVDFPNFAEFDSTSPILSTLWKHLARFGSREARARCSG